MTITPTKSLNLRMPADLLRKVRIEAAKSDHSANSLTIRILEIVLNNEAWLQEEIRGIDA